MKKKDHIKLWAILVAGFLGLESCGIDRQSTWIEYAPEMYHSIPLEPYSQIEGVFSPFRDKMNAQIPPDGTIAINGYPAYSLPDNDSGRAMSDRIDSNPFTATDANLEMGDTLYQRFCGVCHGSNMKGKQGDGPLAKHDAINPPDFTSGITASFSTGRYYQTIMYGKNMMGSYASQLPYEDRWKIIHYIQKTLHPEKYENIGPDGMIKQAVKDSAAETAPAGRHR